MLGHQKRNPFLDNLRPIACPFPPPHPHGSDDPFFGDSRKKPMTAMFPAWRRPGEKSTQQRIFIFTPLPKCVCPGSTCSFSPANTHLSTALVTVLVCLGLGGGQRGEEPRLSGKRSSKIPPTASLTSLPQSMKIPCSHCPSQH